MNEKQKTAQSAALHEHHCQGHDHHDCNYAQHNTTGSELIAQHITTEVFSAESKSEVEEIDVLTASNSITEVTTKDKIKTLISHLLHLHGERVNVS